MSKEISQKDSENKISNYLLTSGFSLELTNHGRTLDGLPKFKSLESIAEFLSSPSEYICNIHGLNHDHVGHLYDNSGGFFAPSCTYSSGGFSCKNESSSQFGFLPDELDKESINNGDLSQFHCVFHVAGGRTHFKPKRGFVYLIYDCVDRNYKIGKTLNVENRSKQLGVNSTGRRELLGFFEARDYSLAEELLHSYFYSKLDKSEWFFLDSDDVDLFLNEEFLMHIGTGVIS